MNIYAESTSNKDLFQTNLKNMLLTKKMELPLLHAKLLFSGIESYYALFFKKKPSVYWVS